jgi:general secretion pathway protein G
MRLRRTERTALVQGAIRRPQHGFTLLEMLVVLVIIGLLAGLVGPRLFGKVDSSKVKAAETQVKMIKGALETLRLDIGRFPTAQEGLGLLYYPPQDERLKSLWQGPYLDEAAPPDPWGNPYQYSLPGADSRPFALYSLGADGVLGGEGFGADIGYLP